MTIWTDLQAAIEAKITALGYTGTLANLGIDQPFSPTLANLMAFQAQLGAITGSGGGAVTVSPQQVQYTETQLTAAGTATTSRSMTGYSQFVITYTVSLNGSTSVTTRAQVSNDGTNWVNANSLGTDTTVTASGLYGFLFSGAPQFVRLLFVSEAGGTGATIDAITRLSVGFDDGAASIEVSSITGAVTLPTGASTSALQTSMSAKLPDSLGTKTSAASMSVTPAFAATSTLSNVASSASSTTLLAANNSRKTAIITNDSTSILYITFNASVASTTNYSIALAPISNGIPAVTTLRGDEYSGEIRGIWASANGFARITEVI